MNNWSSKRERFTPLAILLTYLVCCPQQDYCKSCHHVEKTKSVQHLFLWKCPAIQISHQRFLDDRRFENLEKDDEHAIKST